MSFYKEYNLFDFNTDNSSNLCEYYYYGSNQYQFANDLRSPINSNGYEYYYHNKTLPRDCTASIKVLNTTPTKDSDLEGGSDQAKNICDTSSVDVCVEDDNDSVHGDQRGQCTQSLYSASEISNLLTSSVSHAQLKEMCDISHNNCDYNLLVDQLLPFEESGKVKLRQWKNTSDKVINEIVEYKQSKGKLVKEDFEFLQSKYNLKKKKICNIIKNHQFKRKLK